MSNILNNCKCGCGKQVKGTWSHGHNRKGTTVKHSDETKEKMRISKLGVLNPRYGKTGTCLGRKQTPEQIRKIKEARARQVVTPEHRKNIGKSLKKLWESGSMKKEEWWIWKGDKVGYGGLHERVRKELGRPEECEHCSKTGLKGKQIHWANKSGKYYTNLDDWLRLCVSCHRKYDINRKVDQLTK